MAGAERLENGALFYKVEDKELSPLVTDEDKLRREYEILKDTSDNAWDISEDEENALRLELVEDLHKLSPYSVDEFNELLDKEFSVFKQGEKYDYVKDMKDAYRESLSKTTAQKIFETIPDHVFWDIKKP